MITPTAVAIAEKRNSHIYVGRARTMVIRSLTALRSSTWFVVLSGFFEPVFYLFAFGYGIGQYIDGVNTGSGDPVPYALYIAPALLATSAMNGALMDSTWNVFFKIRMNRFYEAVISTSLGPLDIALGEMAWALLRGFGYSLTFMVVMVPLGLVVTPWAWVAVVASVLVAFGFAAVGMAITSYLKSFQHMSWLYTVLLPMFLFSGSFFPVDVFPPVVAFLAKLLPLWHANELLRGLMLENLSMALIGHALYFVVMIVFGLIFTTRRLTAIFLR